MAFLAPMASAMFDCLSGIEHDRVTVLQTACAPLVLILRLQLESFLYSCRRNSRHGWFHPCLCRHVLKYIHAFIHKLYFNSNLQID